MIRFIKQIIFFLVWIYKILYPKPLNFLLYIYFYIKFVLINYLLYIIIIYLKYP